ncbi:hypothetical protein [Anaerotignum propionicum]|uniref:hypothetical protein n=1 Tax=Anaerotignum propionicum TaxID=28446 RepID=UPI00289F20BC|nr:hypothetical protein [Anaerotignum propionicum]
MKKKNEASKALDCARRDDLMGGEIEKWIRVSRMSKEEISRLAEIGLTTLNERLRNPGEFRVKELRVIADIAGVEVSQLIT